MSKIFVNIGLSLDGYMAPEGMTLEHWDTRLPHTCAMCVRKR